MMSSLFTVGFLERCVSFYLMCMSVCIYVCALLIYSSCGGQKEEADSLELDLHTIVNCHVDAGNQIRSSARAASALNH